MAKRKSMNKAPKPSKPRNEAGEPDWLNEESGMTLDEVADLRELLENMTERIESEAARDNWPKERLEHCLGVLKQDMQDVIGVWSLKTGERLGVNVLSISDCDF